MRLIKRKKLIQALEFITHFAVLSAFLAHLLVPKIVKAQGNQIGLEYGYIEATSAEVSQNEVAEPKTLPESSPRRSTVRIKAVITAYSSTRSQTDSSPFIAASGKRVHDGMIAANWLPFGAKLKIPSLYGDKIFVVEDRMNPRYGYGRMDIWMDAPIKEVRRFGVRRVEVEVFYE